jgi:hypothetical protein
MKLNKKSSSNYLYKHIIVMQKETAGYAGSFFFVQ